MYKCIGVQRSKGNFTDEKVDKVIEYDNYILHMISDLNPDVEGCSATTLKVKANQWENIVKNNLSPSELIGKEVQIVYYINGTKPVLSAIIAEQATVK